MLRLNERQHPVFQVQMHVRSGVPLLKAVPLHTVLAKFRVTQLQLFIAQIPDLVALVAVGSSAANYE